MTYPPSLDDPVVLEGDYSPPSLDDPVVLESITFAAPTNLQSLSVGFNSFLASWDAP